MNKKSIFCEEYNGLSRRKFLSGSAKAGAAMALMPAWLPRVALAQEPTSSSRDIIVSVFLRGGMDGMSVCVPYGDPYYYKIRPTIAIPAPTSKSQNKAIDLNGFFGVNAGFAPLIDAYKAGHLLFVHATGGVPNDWSRSHFDAQRWMELGKPADASVFTGWLGRHLATSTPLSAKAPLRAIALTDGLPVTLAGGPESLPIPDPSNFGYEGQWTNIKELALHIQAAYAQTLNPVATAAATTQQTLSLLNSINFNGYVPAGKAVYPNSDFGNALQATAALIRANIGVEAIHIDVGGWDTHSAEGPINGYMAGLVADVGSSLAAFHQDLEAANHLNFTLVAMSEFGRTAAENASQGTDHGTANAMFLMGGKVAGNRVLAKWPGLAPTEQYQGQDLQITIDYRDILAEIIAVRLLNQANLSTIFPGYTPTFHGVVRA